MFKVKIEGMIDPGKTTPALGYMAKEILRLWRETEQTKRTKEITFTGLGADVKIKISYPAAPVVEATK